MKELVAGWTCGDQLVAKSGWEVVELRPNELMQIYLPLIPALNKQAWT
jgi:hypothetical protein